MTYGDSIVGTVWLKAGTVGGAGGGGDHRPPSAGANTPGDEVPDGGGDATPGSRSRRAQRKGAAAGWGVLRHGAESGQAAAHGGIPGGGYRHQPYDLVEQALLTDRTAFEIDAGDAQHEVGHGLRLVHRRGRLRQEDAAPSEGCRPSAVGQQTKVADSDEAAGHNVEQETVKERVDVEVHDGSSMLTGQVSRVPCVS